ncbi:MAG: hypothetical protein Kow0081_1710 [Candidatus Dojkabacteria bacterium]
MIILKENENIIPKVVEVLDAGGLIIFPTETAYGVGVDATNSSAVTRLLKYKKRPEGKAISIGCYSAEMASKYVEINSTAENIYREFLPGPVTVISKSKGKVDPRLEAENGTLGIRIPARNLMLEIIKKFGRPITTTSANSAGKKTPYSIDDVFETLSASQKELISLVIDGGELPKRLTSTVIDTTTDDLKTYRKGAIDFSRKEIKESFITKSPEETIALGEKLMLDALETKLVRVFLLHGDLGAGKTHFTKGIAKALKISQTVKSPTYTYVSEYKSDKIKGKLFHVDAWRVENKEDLDQLGFQEWTSKENVLVIEWPEIIENLGVEFEDEKVMRIVFKNGDRENERKIDLISSQKSINSN